jgi:GNAT superfamily N-acetyltransferase
MSETVGIPEVKEQAELIRTRNAWLEQQLNPDGLFPEVDISLLDGNLQPVTETLTGDLIAGNAGSLYLSIPGSTDTIGDVVFGKDEKEPAKLVLTDVSILPTVQGKGYGRRLYLEALKALPPGYGAICHSLLSPDAENVWQWLVAAGIARERTVPVSGQLGKYETVF